MGLLTLFPSLSPLLKLVPSVPRFRIGDWDMVTILDSQPYEHLFKEGGTFAFSYDASKGSESSRMFVNGIKFKLDENGEWVMMSEPDGIVMID